MDIGIVTGASAGLGWEFAKQIDAQNNLDELWIIARREERLRTLAEQLDTAARIFVLDLTSKADIAEIERALNDGEYRVQVLVNNAGFGKRANFADIGLDAQLDMVDLNVRAVVHLTHLVLPHMQRGDQLIQVASLAGFLPMGRFAVYAASKAFVTNFSNAIAAELRDRGIIVTAVCPGPVETEFQSISGSIPAETRYLGKATAYKVVAKALRNAQHGKWFSIYGFLMNLLPFLTRITTRKLQAKLAMWRG
ncbi:MAG: SDR family NAD(P)-dependent oxidoreductase [Candidatus Marinimicrobia bacterium]|nr:SDR family NAD(P)-dependent oxidoreductase [Candidatus Neomarinimicrobiota bacterium]